MYSWFVCRVARWRAWWTQVHRHFDWAPCLLREAGVRITNHGREDRIDGWWDQSTARFQRRALVELSQDIPARTKLRSTNSASSQLLSSRAAAASRVCDERLRRP